MKFKSINEKTLNHKKEIESIKKSIQNGDRVYILVHQLGCPPCQATLPEWLKMKNELSQKHDSNNSKNSKNSKNSNNILVADVEKSYIDGMQDYIGDIDGFPTMKLIKDNGKTKQPYESSNVSKKDRSLASFKEWVEESIQGKPSISVSSSPDELLNRLSEMTNERKRQTKHNKRKTMSGGNKRRLTKKRKLVKKHRKSSKR